jgi:ubiquinone biosynthesis protein
LLVYDSDPADAIVRVCEQEQVDLVVVGNVGMRDRTEFLLGSVPNQVSHNARCSVVIVNTDSMRAVANPAHLFYEGQKLRVRAARLLEGLERTLGVSGGTGLQVDFRGARDLTAAIGLAGRRIAVGLAAALRSGDPAAATATYP